MDRGPSILRPDPCPKASWADAFRGRLGEIVGGPVQQPVEAVAVVGHQGKEQSVGLPFGGGSIPSLGIDYTSPAIDKRCRVSLPERPALSRGSSRADERERRSNHKPNPDHVPSASHRDYGQPGNEGIGHDVRGSRLPDEPATFNAHSSAPHCTRLWPEQRNRAANRPSANSLPRPPTWARNRSRSCLPPVLR